MSENPVSILGVDVGGTKTALIAGFSSGDILDRREFPTDQSSGYASWLAYLKQVWDSFSAELFPWKPTLTGISVGGPADWENGILLAPPHLSTWKDAPIRDDVASLVGTPARMEHDGRAGALAEYLFGIGVGSKNMVFLTFGTGIGAGIIINGKPYRGASGSSGEIGHVRVAEDGPVVYGKAGCLESFASGTGIAALARRDYPEKFPAGTEAKSVIDAAKAGDQDAASVLRESAVKLGQGMAMIVDLLNPELIVLGSLSWRVPSWYIDIAKQSMRAEALFNNVEACMVAQAALKDQLQDKAALAAALYGL